LGGDQHLKRISTAMMAIEQRTLYGTASFAVLSFPLSAAGVQMGSCKDRC
jgi:hypothetical protein